MTEPIKISRKAFDALAWVDRAACGDFEAPAMYPHGTDVEGIELAKSVCRRCPVQSECLARALETGEQFGVWGGMSEEERRQLKRRESRARNRKPPKVVPIIPLSDLL